MIVDNFQELLYAINDGFKIINSDYDALCMSNGLSCLEYLKNNSSLDLIILEVEMPDISGWEVFDIIKDNPIWE